VVDAVIPNPQDMPCILKNEPVNIFVLFKPGFEGTTTFALSYTDSQTQQPHQTKLAIQGSERTYPFIEKMAQHRKVSLLSEAIGRGRDAKGDALLGEVSDLRAYTIAESVRHQVLCDLTAFICVGRSLSDNTLQEYQTSQLKVSTDVSTNNLPQYAPCSVQNYVCLSLPEL